MTSAGTWFDGRKLPGKPLPITPDQRHRARLTLARHARDADDLRHLLDVTGLWPAQDAAASEPSEPSRAWGGFIRKRNHA